MRGTFASTAATAPLPCRRSPPYFQCARSISKPQHTPCRQFLVLATFMDDEVKRYYACSKIGVMNRSYSVGIVCCFDGDMPGFAYKTVAAAGKPQSLSSPLLSRLMAEEEEKAVQCGEVGKIDSLLTHTLARSLAVGRSVGRFRRSRRRE